MDEGYRRPIGYAGRLRRSMLYVPGDREAMIAKAPQRGADSLILNLEDAVAPANKELARATVVDALSKNDFGRVEVVVRINAPATATGYRDLLAVAPAAPDAILLPKVGATDEVRFVSWTLARLEELHGLPAGRIKLMCMIESAAGVRAAYEIAACDARVTALIFGATDYSVEIGCATTDGHPALLYAQNRIVLACRAAGIAAIDTPHMNIQDDEGLIRAAHLAAELGFDGKSAIHPAQIGPIHDAFTPTAEQVAWAERVLALAGGDETQWGAAVLDGQLIEAPHLVRARRILAIHAEVIGR
ncbi:MAG: CoA ester lyase [Anaerolineae bacterium]|nr:CoA ester lyase [Anaerolineae bacterium]